MTSEHDHTPDAPVDKIGNAMRMIADSMTRAIRNQLVIGTIDPVHRVLADVALERKRQDERWREQNHPDGTGLPVYQHAARRYRDQADRNAALGVLTWRDVLLEETYEALAEADPVRLRAELIQAVAVGVAWIEAIDRRQASEQP
ncbi:hypothetical protein ABT215_04090 [Streptomyces sp900105755]|uniref:hypothetical protein n=1 Tax=Streptomyces sp. 900105755 TaxID=3154389 RepID=UPI00332C717F